MGRVPPDLTGQLSLVADDEDGDASQVDRSPPPQRSGKRTRRPAREDDAVAAVEVVGAVVNGEAVASDAGGHDKRAGDAASVAAAETHDDRGSPATVGDDQEAAEADVGDKTGPAEPAAGAPETPVAVGPPVEIVVSEVFGPTFQGEGPSLGRRAGFVRLGRCNLDCSFCDTPYTWDWNHFDADAELRTLTVDDVVARLEAMAPEIVVITGGEPLLQQRRLVPLLEACAEHGWPAEVETNGTLPPDEAIIPLVAQWNVSPKLSNSGVTARRAIRPQALATFLATDRAVFKFVVASESDLDEIAGLVKRHDLAPIWVMPEGTDPSTVLSRSRLLADAVLDRGWNFTTRLHTLLWDDTRGR